MSILLANEAATWMIAKGTKNGRAAGTPPRPKRYLANGRGLADPIQPWDSRSRPMRAELVAAGVNAFDAEPFGHPRRVRVPDAERRDEIQTRHELTKADEW